MKRKELNDLGENVVLRVHSRPCDIDLTKVWTENFFITFDLTLSSEVFLPSPPFFFSSLVQGDVVFAAFVELSRRMNHLLLVVWPLL